MSHADLALAGVGWCLRQRWCHLAGSEVSYGQGIPDVLACSSPFYLPAWEGHARAFKAEQDARREAYKAFEAKELEAARAGGRLDRGGWGLACERANARAMAAVPCSVLACWGKSPHRLRIAAMECKATRPDLLKDLRSGKMVRKYGPIATHCHLLVSGPAIRLNEASKRKQVKEALADLADRGLPKAWGVMLYGGPADQFTLKLTTLRSAKPSREPTAAQLYSVALAIGRSVAHRRYQADLAVQWEARDQRLTQETR